ncbi:hypothetical protein K1719_004601 [Acacia pycnantha]|nr:hypothetical protein K1719_004601 [Acacia pycnantha]
MDGKTQMKIDQINSKILYNNKSKISNTKLVEMALFGKIADAVSANKTLSSAKDEEVAEDVNYNSSNMKNGVVYTFPVQTNMHLSTWTVENKEHIVSLIAENQANIFPLIVGPVEKNMRRRHWNVTVNKLTVKVREIVRKMDYNLYEQCHNEYFEKEDKGTNKAAELKDER